MGGMWRQAMRQGAHAAICIHVVYIDRKTLLWLHFDRLPRSLPLSLSSSFLWEGKVGGVSAHGVGTAASAPSHPAVVTMERKLNQRAT